MSAAMTRIPGVIESPTITIEQRTDAEYREQLSKALALLDGRATLPNDVRIEVIECNGDAFKLYQDELDRASDEVSRFIAGNGLIVEPIDYDKAWDALVINGNKWPPKDES